MEEYNDIEKRLYEIENGEAPTPVLFITARTKNGRPCTGFWILTGGKLVQMKQYHSYRCFEDRDETETGILICCANKNNRRCKGATIIYTRNENIYEKTTNKNVTRVKFVKENNDRLKVGNYFRHVIETPHICQGESLSDGFTSFIRSRILNAEEGPVSLARELRCIQSCPRLSKIKVSIAVLKKAVKIQHKQFFAMYPESRDHYFKNNVQKPIVIDLTEHDLPPTEVIVVDEEDEVQVPKTPRPLSRRKTTYVYSTPVQNSSKKENYVYKTPIQSSPPKSTFVTPTNTPKTTPKRTPRRTPSEPSRRSARIQGLPPLTPCLKKRFKTKDYEAPEEIVGNEDAVDLPETHDIPPPVTPVKRTRFQHQEDLSEDEAPFSFNPDTPNFTPSSARISSNSHENIQQEPLGDRQLLSQKKNCNETAKDFSQEDQTPLTPLEAPTSEQASPMDDSQVSPTLDLTDPDIDELEEFINGTLPSKFEKSTDLDISREIPMPCDISQENIIPDEHLKNEQFQQGSLPNFGDSGFPTVLTKRRGITRKHNLSLENEEGCSSRGSSTGLRGLIEEGSPLSPRVSFKTETAEEKPDKFEPPDETLVKLKRRKKPLIISPKRVTRKEEDQVLKPASDKKPIILKRRNKKDQSSGRITPSGISPKNHSSSNSQIEPSATPTKDIIKSVFLKNAFKVPTFEFMEQIRTPKKPSTNNIHLYKNFTQGLGEMIKKIEIFRRENQLPNSIMGVPSIQDAAAILCLLNDLRSIIQS
ncbi:Oidioi.mRNA.OKI2018_I69.chr2.g7225.t1.cds [Oikopleura dioica]|uniref:Oidioi.mRNA.OKI2018_I69.chr2.g7225.t1.cds n=1 Tax=Oikopleura dioica TaxID=34765 RepID=A0ABN7TA87_OIKDI|nr:Oidioi.mRNA.OKI2018_I69.chr2.g7225.t1.cds [Oikopleura dioica]